MRVRSLGAETTAWLLGLDSQAGGWAAGDLEGLMFGADPERGRPTNAASMSDTTAGSRNWHSHTTKLDQPDADNASSAAASRARLRAILADQ